MARQRGWVGSSRSARGSRVSLNAPLVPNACTSKPIAPIIASSRTGSANFSRSGETRQDNDLVALRGASICAGFDAKFDRAWGER